MERENRKYDVTFETLDKRNPIKRTVRVECCDSVHASMLVYREFGKRKIKVKSAMKVRENDEIQKKTSSN